MNRRAFLQASGVLVAGAALPSLEGAGWSSDLTANPSIIDRRYRIEKCLGVGGFASVFLATDLREKRQVAIKRPYPYGCDPSILRSFLRHEANILRFLQRVPSVVRLHDFVAGDREGYLVLEYLPGEDLQQVMEANNHRPFPLRKVVEWGKQICDLLHVMHTAEPPLMSHGIYPQNIILLRDNHTLRFVDFHMTQSRDWNRQRMTPEEQVEMRHLVIACTGAEPPEQIIGRPEPRSDLYVLANTLYYLANGQDEHLFWGEEIEKGLRSSAYQPQERWFFELLRRNLSEDARDRSPSVLDFRDCLEGQKSS